MTTTVIDGRVISLPQRFAPGMVMSETEVSVLHAIWLKRITAKLRWMLDRNQIDLQSVPAKAVEFALEPMAPYNVAEDADDDDPVLIEALSMAEAIITSRMAAEGLPPPKGIDQHARALVNALPNLVEKARLRVEARHRAAALPEI